MSIRKLIRKLHRKIFGSPSLDLLETAEQAITEGLAEWELGNLYEN